jgi:hypothetical protein
MIASDLPNVMVLNSMSKAFRIPGLRIGFVKAPPPLMDRLAPFALPWSVNSLAQTAVRWLMGHSRTGRPVPFVHQNLYRIGESPNRRMYPPEDWNPLLSLSHLLHAHAAARRPERAPVWRHMADHRILIRDCANFTGLSDAFIRISLKTEAENRRATDLLVRLCRTHHATGGPMDAEGSALALTLAVALDMMSAIRCGCPIPCAGWAGPSNGWSHGSGDCACAPWRPAHSWPSCWWRPCGWSACC